MPYLLKNYLDKGELAEYSCFVLLNEMILLYPNWIVPPSNLILLMYFLRKQPNKKAQLEFSREGNKAFITNFKSSLMLLTMISILAVDFKIFPRYFVKSENYGLSLVPDVGIIDRWTWELVE